MTVSEIDRAIFLGGFKSHVLFALSFVTKDVIRQNIENDRCPFNLFRGHFKGDRTFREMRHYYREHRLDPTLKTDMLTTLTEVK